jgi:hypothetical protein
MCDANEDAVPSLRNIPQQIPIGGTSRVAWLRHQERQWFAWLAILHEHLGKGDQGPLTDEIRTIIEIAKKRWLDARQALGHATGNSSAEPEIDPQSAAETASCMGRPES